MFPAAAGLASRHLIPAGMEHTKKTSDRGRTRADLLPGTSALPTILLTRFFFSFFLFLDFHEPRRFRAATPCPTRNFIRIGLFAARPLGELVDWGAANGFFFLLFVVGRSQCNQRIFLLNSIGWC